MKCTHDSTEEIFRLNVTVKVIKYSIFPTNICKVQHISSFINQYVSRSDFFCSVINSKQVGK